MPKFIGQNALVSRYQQPFTHRKPLTIRAGVAGTPYARCFITTTEAVSLHLSARSFEFVIDAAFTYHLLTNKEINRKEA